MRRINSEIVISAIVLAVFGISLKIISFDPVFRKTHWLISTSAVLFALLGIFIGYKFTSKKSQKPKEQLILLEILSPRERDVAKLLKQGLSNSEIAEELHVSISTVKTHVSSILSKLEVASRAKAINKLNEENRLN